MTQEHLNELASRVLPYLQSIAVTAVEAQRDTRSLGRLLRDIHGDLEQAELIMREEYVRRLDIDPPSKGRDE